MITVLICTLPKPQTCNLILKYRGATPWSPDNTSLCTQTIYILGPNVSYRVCVQGVHSNWARCEHGKFINKPHD